MSQRATGGVQTCLKWTQVREIKLAGLRLRRMPKAEPHSKQLKANPTANKHAEIGESGKETSRQQSQKFRSFRHLERSGGVGKDGFLAMVNEDGPLEKHRLLHGFERIGEDQEGPALEPPQHMELALPAALAQFCLGQNYGLASRIALPGESNRIVLLPRQYEYENFGLPVHWRETR